MNYCTSIPLTHIPAVRRMIVIGDIHGDWNALKSALIAAGVTNKHNDWMGADTHVIQVGDIIDRKSRTGAGGDEKSERRILRHLTDLRRKAMLQDGYVHLLLGNHEIMNVMGDFRYVSPMGMTDFGGDRARAFKPGGRVAKFMACNMNSVIQIGNWVFSHAGITEHVSKTYTIDQVNKFVREYLLGNGILDRDHELMDIFWHRRYGTPDSCDQVNSSLRYWQAKNMAIGHTVQSAGISSMCNGALWKVDVGMSGAFHSSSEDRKVIEVLEILDDGDKVNIIRAKSRRGQ